jgi:long-chain acyl-CoA synthetase
MERLQRLDNVGDLQLVGVREAASVAGVVPWEDAISGATGLPDIDIDPDSDACIFYTSGTTGRPKGAQLTHRGCVANLWSMMFSGALQRVLAERQGLIAPGAQAPVPASLITTPLFHVTANNCAAYVTTIAGGKLVHMYKWDAGEALRLIEHERITAMSGVPTMAREVIAHPDFARTDTSSLVSLGGGGAQLQPDLVDKIDRSVATARPSTGYGMTETCGIITAIGGDFFIDKPASCGPAMPCYETKIVGASGEEVPPGEPGELLVRGAQVIRGYLNRPEATAESIENGWLHTGDVARVDNDGFLYIVDRKKDMIISGGFNLFPTDIEAVVAQHPAVLDVTVIGVPHDKWGETPLALVIRKDNASASADDILQWANQRLARHQRVGALEWRDEFPRNALGKVLKRVLRESYWGGAAAV